MTIDFDVLLRVAENGAHAYERHAQFHLEEPGPVIELSQRIVEDAARGFHGIADPTPSDLTNVMCNELFHLMRDEDATDKRRNAFIVGSIIRLCALPDDAPQFRGLGRHPANGDRLYMSIERRALGNDRYAHSCTIETTPPMAAATKI